MDILRFREDRVATITASTVPALRKSPWLWNSLAPGQFFSACSRATGGAGSGSEAERLVEFGREGLLGENMRAGLESGGGGREMSSRNGAVENKVRLERGEGFIQRGSAPGFWSVFGRTGGGGIAV